MQPAVAAVETPLSSRISEPKKTARIFPRRFNVCLELDYV
jgi:hypothetical protein